jgi:hypothetical protein
MVIMKNITLLRAMLVEVHNARRRALKALTERNVGEMDKACIEGLNWFNAIHNELLRQREGQA